MITVTRNNTTVTLTLTLACGWAVQFNHTRHADLDAHLLLREIQRALAENHNNAQRLRDERDYARRGAAHTERRLERSNKALRTLLRKAREEIKQLREVHP